VYLRRHGHVLERDPERHVHAEAVARLSLAGQHVRDLGGVVRIPGEVAELAVVAVLGEVVDHEDSGVREDVLRERGVVVDRAGDGRAAQLLEVKRPLGFVDDRGRGDDYVRVACHRLGRADWACLRVLGGQLLRAVGVPVVQRDAAQLPEQLFRQLQMHGALAPAADDPERLDRPVRERADPEHARRRRTDLRDPGGVHHGERPARGAVR
jgi:hypothetical protein